MFDPAPVRLQTQSTLKRQQYEKSHSAERTRCSSRHSLGRKKTSHLLDSNETSPRSSTKTAPCVTAGQPRRQSWTSLVSKVCSRAGNPVKLLSLVRLHEAY